MITHEEIITYAKQICGEIYYIATVTDSYFMDAHDPYRPQALALYDGPELAFGGQRLRLDADRYLTLLHMPYIRLMQQLDQSRYLNDATFLDIVLHSACVQDDRTMDAVIKARAQRIFDSGPFPMTPEQRMRIQIELTEQISLLQGDILSPCQRGAELAALSFLSTEALLRWQRRWVGRNDRRMCRPLETLIPVDKSGLAEPLHAAIADGSPERLLAIAARLLNDLGGPIQEFHIANPW